jgi:hypothetical protein
MVALSNDHDPESMSALIDHVTSLITRCSDFIDLLEDPEPEACHSESASQTGKRGRPRHNLDLDEAVRLHNLGNSWSKVAKAFGVGRTTLWEYLTDAGMQFARPGRTEISDEELDKLVSALSEDHPFAGQRVMQGHLAAAGVDVSVQRVQESLRRVDAIAVILRSVILTF